MNRILKFKQVFGIALSVMVVGTLVFSLVFGSCFYIARQEARKLASSRIEDMAYTLLSSYFSHTERSKEGAAYVTIDPEHFVMPTEEEVYAVLQQFIHANPHIAGVVMGFEPFLYQEVGDKYGFAPFVYYRNAELCTANLGEDFEFREMGWYAETAKHDAPIWTDAFYDDYIGKDVRCYTIPLHGLGNRLIGVMAIGVPSVDSSLMSGVRRMQRAMAVIGLIGLLLMVACFVVILRHMQRVNIEKAGIESELKIASAIQMSMIPKLYPAFPDRPELDVCGFLRPAKSVGGDLYDYLIRNDKFIFCIGDVSGKGVPASLFMAVVRSLFRNMASQYDDPAILVEKLNDSVAEGNNMNMFCTMFVGILDLHTGHLQYCNAGHNAPIVRKITDEGIQVHFTTPQTNLAVGIMEGFPYMKEESDMLPGEAVFLYTDGVTEAENIHHEMFGEQATLDGLADARAHSARTSKEFIDDMFQTIEHYTQGTEQSDDITMLIVEYKGKTESGTKA